MAQPLLLLLLLLPALLRAAAAEDAAAAAAAPMDRKEKEALYAALAGFAGAGWNGSGLYPDPCGWSPIQGVSCDLYDGLWYPTVISVGPVLDNSLECAAAAAAFNARLFDLKRLRSLTLYSCFGAGGRPAAIPAAGWEKLALLDTLEFRSNPGLAGAIPAGIGALSSLQSLVIADNGVTGELPGSIGRLSSLRRLVVSGNAGLSGPVPPDLGNHLNALLILDLSKNALTGSLPSSLGALTSLLKLDLSSNALAGGIPAALAGLKSLTLLDLRNNSLTGGDGFGPAVQEMVSLQDLLLSNNPIGGELSAVEWGKLPELVTVDLSNASLAGGIPDSITQLKKLRFLALDHNALTGGVPAKLQDLPNLAALYLNGNNLTGRLEFTPVFYDRMGRRFASWSNPSLCYSTTAGKGGGGPVGVQECKDSTAGGEHGSAAAAAAAAPDASAAHKMKISSSALLAAAAGGFLAAAAATAAL